MKSFAEQKIEYFNKLKKYGKIVEELSQKETNKELINILLLPKDEKELEFANHYIMWLDDSLQIVLNALCGNLAKIDLNDSVFVDFMINNINTLQSNNSIEEMKQINKKYAGNGPEFDAKLIYEMLVVLTSDLEEFAKVLYDKCGFDLDNDVQLMQLNLLSSQLKENINPYKYDKESMERFIFFTDCFHDFYMKGLIDPSNLEADELLDSYLEEEDPKKLIK